ncbi:MAG: S1 RNA-binding domain-containing protein [Planctomycetes bacterium]|nr:S1 RNA-binding domain-containing protein [Planctomycetota bacterium]
MRHLTENDVRAWVADTLLSPARTRPVIAVTSHHAQSRGWIDPERLQAAVGEAADVVFLETGDATWALTEALPPRLDVYGGAIRIWWPGLAADADPLQHRLYFVTNPARAEALYHELDAAVQQRAPAPAPAGPDARRPAPVAAPRKIVPAEVTKVAPAWVEVRAGGLVGAIVASDLPHAMLAESLVVGNRVTVASLGIGPSGPTFSLEGLLPNPWDRVASELRPGDVVQGRVQNVDEDKRLVFVDLLPGVTGVCHVSEVHFEFVADLAEHLAPGEITAFAILRFDRATMEMQLSRKRAFGQPPRPLPSLFDGGRPFVWRQDTPAFESLRQARRRGVEPGEFVTLRRMSGAHAPPTMPAVTAEERTRALHDELSALQTNHQNLVAQIRTLRTQLQEAQRAARSAEDRSAAAERQVASTMPLASERAFLAAVREWYARKFDEDDRSRAPLQRMRVGREFLDSVRTTPGVEVDKVIEVCGQVAANIAHTIAGRDVHPLRDGSRGADARTRRRDGAKAWRCALKQAPSAPRLHWWNVSTDGGAVVEFACVGLHDHTDIPE